MQSTLKHAARAAAAVLLVFAAACGKPAVQQAPGQAQAAAASGQLLFVCNQNDATVSVIDIGSNRVVRTIDLQKLGFTANAKPHHVAVEPDGSFWYVTLIGDNAIVKLDRNDKVVAQVPFETPGMLALHPTQDVLYVGRSMTAVNPPQRIGVIRRSDMYVEELPVFFQRPHALALEPRSGTVYTASLATNQMHAINPAIGQVKLIEVAGPPHALMQFAVSPDGRTLAVSAELSHRVLFYDIAKPMAPVLLGEVEVGRQPFDPIFTRDGLQLYLGNKGANTVTVIDVAKRTVAEVIRGAGIAQPHGIAVSPDGRYVYVSNNNLSQTHDMAAHQPGQPMPAAAPAGRGTVVVIDTRTRAIAQVIEVGHNASGIGTRTLAP